MSVVADPTLAQPTAEEIEQLDAWWRANNYLTIGQIYDWAQQG